MSLVPFPLKARNMVTGAHKEGLSYGKYRAFLELQKLEPGITPEEIRGMSMREIRERIEYLAPGSVWADPDGEPADSGFCGQGECPGMGHGHGRQGRGRRCGHARADAVEDST